MIADGIIEAVNPPVRAHSRFIVATASQFTELGRQYCDIQLSAYRMEGTRSSIEGCMKSFVLLLQKTFRLRSLHLYSKIH
jgi:hypothetical protein